MYNAYQKYQHILTRTGLFSKEGAQMLIISALFLLVAAGSFGLGRLSGLAEDRGHLNIHPPDNPEGLAKPVPAPGEASIASTTNTAPAAKNFVASKNGTKYYSAGCAGASRIKAANQVWFASTEDAVAAGYALAVGCSATK